MVIIYLGPLLEKLIKKIMKSIQIKQQRWM